MQHFIVDGYNVIHQIPSLKKLLAHNAEGAREQLIYYISRLTLKRKFRCTVVFDGEQANTLQKQSVHAPIHVLYSFPQIADAKIKQMIEESKNRSLLVIISSDREILNFAQVCACETHTSKYFINLLFEEQSSGEEKDSGPLSKTQVEEWLKIFGEK
ncbi:MAG: NYN domain-containing protein [Bacteroidetes bacterium]|nr:NYN domain-containing protein [Bacteroidota bacterium]